jgi:hypothetical protein
VENYRGAVRMITKRLRENADESVLDFKLLCCHNCAILRSAVVLIGTRLFG